MPDLRSLEERIAEVIREEAAHESVKVCCGDFENCRIPCTPRADHWKEKAKAPYVPQPGLQPGTPGPRTGTEPKPEPHFARMLWHFDAFALGVLIVNLIVVFLLWVKS